MKKLTPKASKLIKLTLTAIVIFQLGSCALIFVPKSQKVTLSANNDSTLIYVENEEHGTGSVDTKVNKEGVLDVVLKTEGYPTQYEVIRPTGYAYWAIPLCIIDIPIFGAGFSEFSMSKMYTYNNSHSFNLLPKLVTRSQTDKYISFEGINIDIANKNVDIDDHYIYDETADEEKEMDKQDSLQYNIAAKKKINTATSAPKKEKTALKKLEKTDLSIKGIDGRRSSNVYKTLNKTGFIDTINTIFLDHSNTIVIEGQLTKSSIYHFAQSYSDRPNGVRKDFYRSRVGITWFIKNSFGEKIDSVINWTSSGATSRLRTDDLIDDAVDRSLQQFIASDKAKNNLKIDTNYSISDVPQVINQPKNMVLNAEDATLASVIIKRKDKGHGSGFAISNDGYIITNYHVIAGDYENKPAEFTVILSNGEEVPAKVVRYNKMRDVALLKVDLKFEKAFRLSNEKTFKRLMEVYAVGTPKSIELGQSVSIGILSNERKTNNNNLLQLNMSINKGNSGGPLFDKQGNLHGIVTSKLVGFSTEGVSFAIPTYAVATYLNLK